MSAACLLRINIRIRSNQIWFVGSGSMQRSQFPATTAEHPACSALSPPAAPAVARHRRSRHRAERKMERGHLHSGTRTERTGKLLSHQ